MHFRHSCHAQQSCTMFVCELMNDQVHRNLMITANRNPSFHERVHKLPFTHIVITDSLARSGARTACITVPSLDVAEALTIFELARTTQVPVPGYIDSRRTRMASTWWMQRRTARTQRATSSYDNVWYTQPCLAVVPLSFQTLRHTRHAEFTRTQKNNNCAFTMTYRYNGLASASVLVTLTLFAISSTFKIYWHVQVL